MATRNIFFTNVTREALYQAAKISRYFFSGICGDQNTPIHQLGTHVTSYDC